MAIADEWDKVDEAFDRLERYRVLHPTLAAMRKVALVLKENAAFAEVHPVVSMASLVLARGQAERRVDVAWTEEHEYRVAFVDSKLQFSEPTNASEDDVVRVLREYLDRL
ncbi:hypothetical protein D7X30_34155 [Corallococcus sp. AB011P]|uniref:hypothetical protein n=1 Tax=Corallococcus sp. AB011P TaxID=2316735 RepID=UPI000EA24757|nr:hypothetical protein [Corallococcus sp. AB011P]RKG52235.1 hypothetical protein D7X30_34155 [Corallococcus sp. AB011P]